MDDEEMTRIDGRTLVGRDGFAYDYELLDFEERDERDAEEAAEAARVLVTEPGARSRWAR